MKNAAAQNLRLKGAPSLDFNEDEIERYSRHILLPQVGAEGQARLRAANILVIGAGGLGSPALLYLAAAGVGRIAIVDSDHVDRSNLQRQIAHGESNLGQAKAESAAAAMREINPLIEIEVINQRFEESNALQVLKGRDLVLDGCDNFTTRYLVNDAAFLCGVPLISASVYRFEGQLMTFSYAPQTPCYRCVFPSPPPAGTVPSCSEAGVLGAVVGVLGTMQASEAVRLLAGVGTPRAGKLMRFDALTMRLDHFEIEHNPKCDVCGVSPTILGLHRIEEAACGVAEHQHKEPSDV